MWRMIPVLFLLFGGWLQSAPPDALAQAKRLHEEGAKGNKEAVIRSVELLEELVAREPQNQLARVWLGSAYTLRARDMGFDPDRLATLRKGGAIMDEAVNAAPDDPAVRIVRAMNSYHLPAIFGRKKIARQDFLILMKRAESDTAVPREDRQLVYYYGGRVLKETGDRQGAVAAWRKGLELDPNSPTAAELKRLLH